MTESNPDTLPTPIDLTGPCPRCARVSNFSNKNMYPLVYGEAENAQYPGALETGHVLRCMGCQGGVLTVVSAVGRGIHWYPSPGAGTLDEAVNDKVASCYAEGMQCLGVGASRAAAVMFRAALHCFIKDKGNEKTRTERHLKSALKHMKDDGSLHKSLWSWADELNQLGNEGAHPEDYDEVTIAEATGLGDFVRQLIKLEYEMEAQLERARNRDNALLAAEKAESGSAADEG